MYPPSFGEYWTFLDPFRLLFCLPNTAENKLPKRQNPNRKIHLLFPSQAAAALTGVGRGRTKEVAASGLLKSFIECHCWSSEMRRSKRWARRWVCSSRNEESIWWLGSWCCPMASRRHRWERGAVQPRGCQDPPVTSTSCKCVQAESLEDPAGLNVEILVSYVSAYNL